MALLFVRQFGRLLQSRGYQSVSAVPSRSLNTPAASSPSKSKKRIYNNLTGIKYNSKQANQAQKSNDSSAQTGGFDSSRYLKNLRKDEAELAKLSSEDRTAVWAQFHLFTNIYCICYESNVFLDSNVVGRMQTRKFLTGIVTLPYNFSI